MSVTAHYAGCGRSLDMRNCALAFAAGAVSVHWLAAVRPLWPWALIAGLGLLPARRLRVVAVAAMGVGWGGYHALDAIERRIDAACMEARVSGRVVDLPARLGATRLGAARVEAAGDGGIGRRFLFAPDTASCFIPGRLRLSWFAGPPIRGGERWQLRVRLKAPRGTANANGFDAGRWYARSRLSAVGYVITGTRLDEAGFDSTAVIDAARETLRERLLDLTLVNAGVLAALTLGDSAAIPRPELERYRRTGTMHLLVISGLHVGVITAFGFFLGRVMGLLTAASPRLLGAGVALLFAGGYVLLAGAGLSLIRAFVMSATAMLALLAGRSTRPSAVFAYALAVVLVVDPMAPLTAGFWLSFGAVAVLLGVFAPRPRSRAWVRSALVAQLAIALVFVPASVGLTGLIHPLGVIVNLVAIPVVTLLVVPLALAGVALLGTPLGVWLLTGADFCVSLVSQVLIFADHLAPRYIAHPGGWLPWMMAAGAACLLPVSRLAKVALAAAMVAVLLTPRPVPPAGEVAVTILDVGQGTAVLVETARHTLLYDTGPAFRGGTDAGTGVVLPALRGRGGNAVDVLMLSHGDLDHIGGAASVLANAEVGAVLTGEPVPGIDAERCYAGQHWRWDGVDFTVLSPATDRALTGNNASCVLLIETRAARAVLVGDIEKAVEEGLEVPPVDLLLAPHHGSATSSGAAFVAATRPRVVVMGAGWANRFGHPHPAVVERYRNVGAHILSTAVSGALYWRSAHPGAIVAERCRGSPYWRLPRRQPASAPPEFLSSALGDCGIGKPSPRLAPRRALELTPAGRT